MNLDDLYKQVIMDHYQKPRNKGELGANAKKVYLKNTSCGDYINLYLDIEDNKIKDVKFTGEGCSISQASASMMTQLIKGKSIDEIERLNEIFANMLKGEEVDLEELEDAQSLQGVAKFPARFKCASLAWNALKKGITD